MYLISICRSSEWFPLYLDALFHDAHVFELLLLGVGLAADVAVFGVGHVAVGEGDFAGCGYAAAAGGGLGVARYGAANLKPDLVRECMDKKVGMTTATRLYRYRLRGTLG